jgi:hypothetical protein
MRRKRALFFLGLVPAFILGLAGVVMGLWNAILPPVLAVNPLSYWQALGLLVLCRILFGGLHFRPWSGHRGAPSKWGWNDKWATMTEEERQELRQRWQERCAKRAQK